MDLDSPQSIIGECTDMVLAQQSNMRNRSLINRLFNGEAPISEDERRSQNLKTNVNFLEATRIASNAKSQLDKAFKGTDRYFNVTIDKGPVHKRATHSAYVTNCINKELKKSRLYRSTRESSHAQVVLHGPGPQLWPNKRTPIPKSFGVEDVMVPSGTLLSMENLDRFGVYQELTWAELNKMTKGPAVDAGWNMRYIKALMVTLFAEGVEPVYQGNRWLFPEKVYEDVKEGAAQSASSSLPKIGIWNFFYRNEDNDKWARKIALDFGTVSEDAQSEGSIEKNAPVRQNQDFLYEDESYADDWQHIVHWYIGNCSNVAPFRYWSIRSMGYLLYGVCMIQNKLRCRTTDHIFQALLTLFHNVSDDNREKVGMIDLTNFGVVPDGLNFVKAQERHTVDWNLVMMGLSQGRQLMAESAQGFIPQILGDQDKEMTAQEFLGRMNMSIAMTSAVQSQLAEQSGDEYREICRRFCIKGNPDPMAKAFREKMRKEGVPEDLLDIEAWNIVPEQTYGAGNKAVELNVTQALMQEIFPLADPNGQRQIARRRVLALTDSAEEALLIFPDAPQPPSDDVQYAQVAYSVLMLGQPFAKKEGVNHVAYAAMLMQMMQITLQQIAAAVEQPQGLAIAADKIIGLFNVAQHVQEEINIIARVESQVDKAKMMFKALTEMSTQLTNLAKQLMAEGEAQQGQQGIPPEKLAKIQEIQLQGEVTRQQKALDAELKREQKQIQWSEENNRRNASTVTDAQRKMLLTQADIAAKDLQTEADILNEARKPQPTSNSK